jgi:hypothetical protein
MLPKETVPEGSKKIINGKEVYTLHYFTMEEGNCFETVSGDFIYPNGESVKDRTLLEALPEQHRQRALAWWEKKFGDGSGVVEENTGQLDVAGEETVQPTVADLMAENEVLKAQIAAMSTDSHAGQGPFEPGKDLKEKEIKRPTGKQKADRGTTVLKQMGINV